MGKRRKLYSQFARFLVSGGLNTVLTYGFYLLLLQAMSYWAAYSVSFVTGIGLAYFLNRVFVFQQHRGAISWFGLPVIYGIQYGAGVALLWIWVSVLGFDARVGPLAVIALTMPLTFFLMRMAFVRQRTEEP